MIERDPSTMSSDERLQLLFNLCVMWSFSVVVNLQFEEAMDVYYEVAEQTPIQW